MRKPPFDYSSDASRLKNFKIKSYDFKSQSDMKIRPTGNYGDNAMLDSSMVNEGDDTSSLDRLLDILTKSGITVDDIKDGAKLSPSGMQKIAGAFGVSEEEIETLMNSLPAYIDQSSPLTEEGVRYSFEYDYLGNVTITDNQSADGEPVMLSGSKGHKLLGRLEENPRDIDFQQKLLAQAMSEDLTESDDGFVDDFSKEIANDAGSFNFPWKVGTRHGTGTAFYRGDDEDFEITIEDVRNQDGDPIKVNDTVLENIKSQAVAYIPEA